MKRLITASIVLVAIVALPLSHLLMAKNHKIAICHKGHVISVGSQNAADKHLQNHPDCHAEIVAPDGSCLCEHPGPPELPCTAGCRT